MKWSIVGKERVDEVAGGLNRYVAGLVDGLRAIGDETALFVVGDQPRSVISRLVAFFWQGLTNGPQSDVINIHFALYGLPFLLGSRIGALLRQRPKPVVIQTFHGPWWKESEAAGQRGMSLRFKRTIEVAVSRWADTYVVLSRAFATELISEFNVDERSIHIVAPGVDPIWFGEPSDRDDADTIRLVTVRRLTRRMGIMELLDCLARLRFEVQGLPVTLDIVGTGELHGEIEEWVTHADRGKQVTLHGRLSDDSLVRVLAQADLAVVPTSSLEGFGLVVLESMARGIPVITTGEGGLTEAMGPWGHSDLFFTLDDPSSLSRAIERGLKDRVSEDAQARLIEYARSFTWDATAHQVHAIAERLIEENDAATGAT